VKYLECFGVHQALSNVYLDFEGVYDYAMVGSNSVS